ncbi:MAG: penicillin-binding protein, partial [Mycobacterium sp.]
MNNEGQQDHSAADTPNGAGAHGGPKQAPGSPRPRSAVPPDDRLTTILPPVRDDAPDHLRDPIEAVKAALDGRPSSRTSELRDPLEMATAALEGRTPRRYQQPSGGPPGGR